MRGSGPRAREGADVLGMLSTRGSVYCKRGVRSTLRVDVVHSSRTLLGRRERRVQEAAERQKRDGRRRGKLDWLIRSEEEARRVRVTELPFLLSHVVTSFWLGCQRIVVTSLAILENSTVKHGGEKKRGSCWDSPSDGTQEPKPPATYC